MPISVMVGPNAPELPGNKMSVTRCYRTQRNRTQRIDIEESLARRVWNFLANYISEMKQRDFRKKVPKKGFCMFSPSRVGKFPNGKFLDLRDIRFYTTHFGHWRIQTFLVEGLAEPRPATLPQICVSIGPGTGGQRAVAPPTLRPEGRRPPNWTKNALKNI